MRSAPLLGLIASLTVWIAPAFADDGQTAAARAFLEDYLRSSVHIRSDGAASTDQKDARSKALLYQDYDFTGVPKAILGRYWDRATPEQQGRYLAMFEDYLVAGYGPTFDSVASHLKVTGAAPLGARMVVHTLDVTRPENSVPIDWVLVSADGQTWRIADVVVNGAGSVETMRQDFGGVLRANNGDIEALLSALRRRIDALRKVSS